MFSPRYSKASESFEDNNEYRNFQQEKLLKITIYSSLSIYLYLDIDIFFYFCICDYMRVYVHMSTSQEITTKNHYQITENVILEPK